MRPAARIFTIEHMPIAPPAPPILRTNRPRVSAARLDEALADFVPLRPRLLGIAQRILGSRAEAEDVVQDAWLRWQTYDRRQVLNPTAFLVTTTTRLAINASQSARVRRETSVERWSTEPASGPTVDDPTVGVERTEALRDGLDVLIQRLAPTERAAYVLRQAFDYPYPRIAQVLQTSTANARQLVSRAAKHLTVRQPRPGRPSAPEPLLRAFVDAARHGEVAALERLFAADASDAVGARGPVLAAAS
jgi:RNA polymerase sigma-70 factor (ECF subfamily)